MNGRRLIFQLPFLLLPNSNQSFRMVSTSLIQFEETPDGSPDSSCEERLKPTLKGIRMAHERMQRLVRLDERELVENFVQGRGPGGQKLNKTSSAVFIKDVASGICVKTQATREQSRNRKIARELLQLRIDDLLHPVDSVLKLKAMKIARQKARHSRRLTVESLQDSSELK